MDMWENTEWYHHVPNDALQELQDLIRLCARLFELIIKYVTIKDTISQLDMEQHKVDFTVNDYDIVVNIITKGD